MGKSTGDRKSATGNWERAMLDGAMTTESSVSGCPLPISF
jgi:hypothetical protein